MSNDGMIAMGIIVYLLGLIGTFALQDFFAESDHEPWWIPAIAPLWPLEVPLGILLVGVACVIEGIAQLLCRLRGEWPEL